MVRTYTGTVQADGAGASAYRQRICNLTASQYTVSASVSDKAGNPASANHGLAVDLTVPVLTIILSPAMTLLMPPNTDRRWRSPVPALAAKRVMSSPSH
ncbi:hypothetical protein ACLB1Q_13120 [Escherichia coli]